jgi:threonine/homoserine/homoserine lactone efflux protein
VTGLAALVAYGFVLGWSVAWPPGPINAEMVRRGLARGFRPAFGVGLGACSGDALWAIAVVLGAGLFIGPAAQAALAWISTALLLFLAAIFLLGAWQGWRAARGGAAAPEPSRPPSAQGSYWLGLGMALSSPWNLAFWLAVIGRTESQMLGVASALIVAGSVILGAALWCVVLCTTVARLRVTFSEPSWQVAAKGATGLLMLGFAARGLWLAATA